MAKPLAVMVTDSAANDLSELYDYIKHHDSEMNADYVLTQIETRLNSLARSPSRGHYPNELLELGIREYREIVFKPYRIIYRIINNTIYILLIVDGRRDMVALLQRRLLNH